MTTLTLVREEQANGGGGADPLDLLRAASLALCRLQDVEDDHIRRMLRSVLTHAARRDLIDRQDLFAGRTASGPIHQRIDEAVSAIEPFLAATEVDIDPFTPTDPLIHAHRAFEVMLNTLRRARPGLLMSEIDRKVKLYFERWNESDLPDEPELARFARRALVEAGVWKREQVAAMGDAELLAIKGIGPKSLAQLRVW